MGTLEVEGLAGERTLGQTFEGSLVPGPSSVVFCFLATTRWGAFATLPYCHDISVLTQAQSNRAS